MIDERLRRFLPPAFRAFEHTRQVQNGMGMDGAADVPRKVICMVLAVYQ